jgi:signal transduction histidine kinase
MAAGARAPLEWTVTSMSHGEPHTQRADAGSDAAAQRLRFLAEASRVLAESLDYEATLKTVARLAVPAIADWCVVDLLQADGALARVAIEHRDPIRLELARCLQQRFPPSGDATAGPTNVTRTGQTEFAAHIGDAVLLQIAPEPERSHLLTGLGMNSYISVPLATRDRILGSITFFTEATRVFNADDVLMAEDLARRAATAIDNARLYDEARRAVRSRDDILAIVTHDLRTPLSAIMTAVALELSAAADNATGARMRSRAEIIQRSARHMNRLIRDLTDLGQIDGGRLAIERTSQAATPLVRHVIETLQPVAARRGSHVGMDAIGTIPPISCDGDRIIQVLSNLASNAIKAGARSVTIRIEARAADVLFTVEDTGPGIVREDLPHMFDRYWRATTARYKGTGLGLPIAKGIVDAHGGQIWVKSEIGAGTRFFFTLPC